MTFACSACGAAPEQISEGKAQMSIVRHKLGCAILCSQVLTRWPLAPKGLPETPGPRPFANRTGFTPRRKRAPKA